MSVFSRLLRSPEGAIGAGDPLPARAGGAASPASCFPGDPLSIVGPALVPPFTDASFPLGTDRLGRDVLAELVHGARASLAVGIAAALVAVVIGSLVGTLAGFAGGLIDEALMRVVDAFQIVPAFLLALAFVSVVGASLPVVVLAIALGAWTGPARLARAEVLSIRERDYVAAARVIGMRPLEIAFREILPNALPPVLALSSVIVASSVLIEAALSFLGLERPQHRHLGLDDSRGPQRAALRAVPVDRAWHRADGHRARRLPLLRGARRGAGEAKGAGMSDARSPLAA